MICYHCHSPISNKLVIHGKVLGVERDFCCHACLAVAQLIEGCDLEQYYKVRDSASPKPSERVLKENWQAYDIEAIKNQYVYRHDGINEVHLYIEGIHCGACAWLIKSLLRERLGLEDVLVNATTARAEIRYSDAVKLSQILEGIALLGYRPNLFNPEQIEVSQNKERNQYLLRLIVSGLGMMQVMMFATGLYTGDYYGMDREYSNLLRWISFVFSTPVFFYGGWPFLKNAYSALKIKRLNMDVPVSLALAGAYFASSWHVFIGQGEVYFDSVTMFIFFLSIGRFLEFLTRRRARLNEVQFAKLLPEAVERHHGDDFELVALNLIQVGDVIRVMPTQTIAIDGEIVRGKTRVSESMLSGESRALSKKEGDLVFAGSHNLESPIEVKVLHTGQETVLAGIRRLMARAQQHKSATIEKTEKIAQWSILSVLILAVIAYVLWQFIDASRAFEIVLAILVATCPCALSLATPVALTSAVNHAHQQGILIKESSSLEKLDDVQAIVFDKTGTLTEGDFRLLKAEFFTGNPEFHWQMAKSLERHSAHPVAWAVVAQTEAPILELENVFCAREGVCGDYQDMKWAIGNASFIQHVFPHLKFEPTQEKGVAVYLACAEAVCAFLLFDDPPRVGIADLMKNLSKRYGLYIMSGDIKKNVEKMAEFCEISNYQGMMSAEDKLSALKLIDKKILMVGDGMNDAPVMAGAHVSVAVGKANPLSQTQADIVLMRHGPEALPYLFDLSVRTKKIIQQNLWWATAYNLLVIPLAIAGFLTPWIAAIGMSLSSLIVVVNALRLSRLPKIQEA